MERDTNSTERAKGLNSLKSFIFIHSFITRIIIYLFIYLLLNQYLQKYQTFLSSKKNLNLTSHDILQTEKEILIILETQDQSFNVHQVYLYRFIFLETYLCSSNSKWNHQQGHTTESHSLQNPAWFLSSWVYYPCYILLSPALSLLSSFSVYIVVFFLCSLLKYLNLSPPLRWNQPIRGEGVEHL